MSQLHVETFSQDRQKVQAEVGTAPGAAWGWEARSRAGPGKPGKGKLTRIGDFLNGAILRTGQIQPHRVEL